MNSKITKYAFVAGAVYFCCMAMAHFFGLKWPLLFVYYDTPYYTYQDKIISFAVCAYIALFIGASKHRDIALYAIIIMGITTLGLAHVNVSHALTSILSEDHATWSYWLQTSAIAAYTLVLSLLYFNDGKEK